MRWLSFLQPGANQEAAQSEIQRLFAKNDIPLDALYFIDTIPMDPRHHSKVEYSALREQLLKIGDAHVLV